MAARKIPLTRLSPEAKAALAKLNPRDAAVVLAYATPGSETVGNGAASVRAVDPGVHPDHARRVGYRIMQHPAAQEAIEAILARHGLDRDRRAVMVAEMLQTDYRSETTVHVADCNGQTQRTVTRRSQVQPKERLHAIDLLNRMDGVYEEARVARDVAREAYVRELDAILPVDPMASNRRRRKRARQAGVGSTEQHIEESTRQESVKSPSGLGEQPVDNST